METVDLAKLIKRCAFEMNAYDKDREDNGLSAYVATDGPSKEGQRICEETARGAGLPALGYPVYLMLAYAWNDALDWADHNGAGPG